MSNLLKPRGKKRRLPGAELRRNVLAILNERDDGNQDGFFAIDPRTWMSSPGMALNEMPTEHRAHVTERLRLAINDLASGDILTTPLQTFAVGLPGNEELDPELSFLAPDVQLGGRISEYLDHSGGFGAESELNDERGIKAEFKTIDQKGTRVALALPNRGLASEVDEDQYPNVQAELQNRVQRMIARLKLNRLRRAYAALVAIAANTDKVWSTASGKDPDMDIMAEIDAGEAATGVRANRVLFGSAAWSLRVQSHRAQASAGGFSSAGMSEAELASALGVQGVLRSRAHWADVDGTIARVVGSKALMFRSFPGASLEDSSVMKTFWAPAMGQRYRVLPVRQVGDKLWRVAVECNDKVVVTGPATNTVRSLTVTAS